MSGALPDAESPCPCRSGEKYKRCHGAPARAPQEGLQPPPDTVAWFFDPDKDAVVFVTGSMLLNQLQREQPRINSEFDQSCAADLAAISWEMARTTSIIAGAVLTRGRVNAIPRVRACAVLLGNAEQSVFAAITLLRAGFRIQAPVLLRTAIEQTACALAVNAAGDSFDKFQAGSLTIASALKVAKTAIPLIGPLYGHLSEQFVHVGGPMHARPHLLDAMDRDDQAAAMNFQLVKSVVVLHGIATELIFYNQLEDLRCWRKVGDNAYQYAPEEAELERQAAFIGHPLGSEEPPPASHADESS